jgi:uncharacterized repeat protein (TIGR03803 family)
MRAAHVFLAVFCFQAFVSGGATNAAGLQVLHSVCRNEDCGSGDAGTAAGLLRDEDGNLFGTTLRGGKFGAGEIFELSPDADKGGWNYERIFSFCSKTGCRSGAIVWGPLIRDADGNLYGVTTAGGRGHFGTFFELSPGVPNWSYKVLHDFCATGGSSCTEAQGFNFGLTYAGASTGAPYDGHSPLYGSSESGGCGFGNVFMLTPRPGKKKWAFRQVYDFCGSYPQCLDGALPWMGNVVVDGTGHLFGTTMSGGATNHGLVYALTPSGKNQWLESVLYNFCSLADCADGQSPSGTLLLDSIGNLYGTTGAGPSNCADPAQCGVVFRLSPGSPWQEAVLHTFCQRSGCADGAGPGGALILDVVGNLVGTTFIGGGQNAGAIFRLGQNFNLLYSFCSKSGCIDGQYPQSAIALDLAGNVFGVTEKGGSKNYGAVFEFTP